MCPRRQHQGATQKKYISGYLLTATSFQFTFTDDILKYILTKGSTYLLEKPTIVVTADAEMKNIPFVCVGVL